MSQELNIQKVAHVTGLSVHTLRYYEKIGLLDPVVRTSSGYRHYTEADLSWIEFLKRLRETGMPIATMQKFAELRRKGETTAGERRTLLEEHEKQVQEHVLELQRNLKVIGEKITYYAELEEQVNGKKERNTV